MHKLRPADELADRYLRISHRLPTTRVYPPSRMSPHHIHISTINERPPKKKGGKKREEKWEGY
ncbi:Uncharacterized protein APZ42_026479 [Daphnia magna]|uniref:Uncharacterized protein n=1 Tax=Daphnia magna TaxID=35525 RepID=A0A164S8Y2_9CRUS|nr:Uncharacterized protein APZ42_026479 [Daphnia magna]